MTAKLVMNSHGSRMKGNGEWEKRWSEGDAVILRYH